MRPAGHTYSTDLWPPWSVRWPALWIDRPVYVLGEM